MPTSFFYEKASTENIITVMKIHCSTSEMYGHYFVQFAEECHNKMMGVTPEKTTSKDNSKAGQMKQNGRDNYLVRLNVVGV